eukprot:TRINITY_DN2049_c0_g1_i1.p1 TRINITY_DN2049_c0_g1~~TRINITY_DN2049_c0_g1_i1.p1  ORF type:complete len:407 (+),score=71.38 TRINITY_DN2049_c0_g1_i1:2-1222(+)
MDTVIDVSSLERGNPPSSSLKRRTISFNVALCVCCLLVFVICSLVYRFQHTQVTIVVTNYQPLAERYLYQSNYLKYNSSSVEYDFVIVSDMDKKSKSDTGKWWNGVLQYGKIVRTEQMVNTKDVGVGREEEEQGDVIDGMTKQMRITYRLEWLARENITTAYNEAGRGMELSELVYYDGKLLSCDDRTGIIFEIVQPDLIVVPLHIVTEGNGKSEKGFKCEWMTVVNDKLYIGSIGKEFTKDGEIMGFGSQWVKVIDRSGRIEHIPWRENYEALRKLSATQYPGYLVHEAVMWNPIKREWTILPRRLSTDPYDENEDEERGTNVMFIATEDFSDVKMKKVGLHDPLRGTSSFKFIPFREGEIIQLKTIEKGERIESFITVLNINTGEILMEDQPCGDIKFEGVEIV